MTVVLLISHGLLAVTLLGAITHQAISVSWPARATAASFVGRMRMVSASTYVNAIVVLYMLTAILGGIIYPIYRISVRFVLEQSQLYAANGSFELKEHFVAVAGHATGLLVCLAPTSADVSRARAPS